MFYISYYGHILRKIENFTYYIINIYNIECRNTKQAHFGPEITINTIFTVILNFV